MRAWVVAAVVLSVGCGASTNTNIDDLTRASYRVALSSTFETSTGDSTSADIYHARGEESPDFPNISENVGTGYVGVAKGSYDINLRERVSGEVRAEYPTNFAPARRYLFVTRTSADGTVSLTQHLDNREDPGNLTVIRFINATTDGTPFVASVHDNGSEIATPPVDPDLTTIESTDTTKTIDADAANLLSVTAGVPIPITINSRTVTTPPLPAHFTVTIVVRDASTAPTLLLVPPVSPVNSTQASVLAAAPQVLVVNNVPGDPSFGTMVPSAPSITIGGRTAALPTLEAATTNVVIASSDPANDAGLTFLTYKDATTDGTVRAVNALVGSSAPDVSLTGTAIVYSDLVFSAAASQTVPDPTSVTGVTATDSSGTFVFMPAVTASTRYLLVLGNVASQQALTTLSLDQGSWSAATVPAN